MQRLLDEIVDLMKDATSMPTDTSVPGLLMIKGDVPSHQLAAVYKPMIGFVVQGTKVLSVGRQKITADGPSYFLLPMHVPVTATVHSGHDGLTYMSLGLNLDIELLHSLLRDIALEPAVNTAPKFAACKMDAEHIEAWLKLLRLIKTAEDIPALAPAYKREILYRILKGPQGLYLRQLGLSESGFSKIAQTVQWMRKNYMRPIDVKDVARNSGMAITTFHRQFKRATGLSPIQFQKQLRLLEARNLLAFEGYAVTGAAFEVGYESPSQFNREYSRFFGASPARDAAAIRQIELSRAI